MAAFVHLSILVIGCAGVTKLLYINNNANNSDAYLECNIVPLFLNTCRVFILKPHPQIRLLLQHNVTAYRSAVLQLKRVVDGLRWTHENNNMSTWHSMLHTVMSAELEKQNASGNKLCYNEEEGG